MEEIRSSKFKVVLLIDGIETEEMFVEAASHREAWRAARAALVTGKACEQKKWALRITEYGLPDKRPPSAGEEPEPYQ